jgi:large subunit ribosomal protein L28
MIARRGLPKKKGGIGLKTTGITHRVFRPNLQRVRVVEAGRVRRARVCTACIRSGKIRKAP